MINKYTRLIPLTVSYFVEEVLLVSRNRLQVPAKAFMPVARASVKHNILTLRTEDPTHAFIIRG